ncbi:hypothetical protein [Nesterenkonia sp. AN1]|uniref:hypothetical protein n=1 Tax=Nesterenkonia sp. AN1 TaxID=652017 RepID=UPI00190FBDAB|nr:hypothetical protein [Nesterenkonia sp. AN1]
MTGRVEAVVFDVLETLLDLDPLGARLEEVGQPASVLGPFFMRFQRDAMALTLAGDVADFTRTARQSLRTETKQALSDTDIDYVMGASPAFKPSPMHSPRCASSPRPGSRSAV